MRSVWDLFANPKISVLWNKAVESFLGDPTGVGLTALSLRDTQTGEMSEFATQGAFVAIGHAPSTELFQGKLATDSGPRMAPRAIRFPQAIARVQFLGCRFLTHSPHRPEQAM